MYLYDIVWTYGRPVSPFFNDILDWFVDNNMEFMAAILYQFLGYYFLFSAFRGNFKFGLRNYMYSFYPLLPNESFANAFLFRAFASCVWTFTMLQFLSSTFATYM